MVPPKYYEFLDVFFRKKSDKILSHRPYNHYIELKKGTKPLYGPFYRMSHKENEELHKYYFDNLDKRFIRASQSSAILPILFLKSLEGTYDFVLITIALILLLLKINILYHL